MAGGYGGAPSIPNMFGGAASTTPWGAIAGAGAALIPSIFSALRGAGQRRQARRIRANAVDPGYTQNAGVLQNKATLENRYNNYTMPGYSQALSRLGSNAATAYNNGVQGATSSADVLDLATQIAYGTGQQQNQLMLQNAQGREGAFGDYLNANVAAGQEAQDANAYERSKYQQKLAEAAALYGASDQNQYNAATGAASVIGSFVNDRQESRRRRNYPSIYGMT